MGIVPVWGFQLLIAIAVSIFLRLNKALVVVAANISIPPMLPVIIWLSHVTGRIWMGENARTISFSDEITLVMIKDSLLQYLAGAVTLAILAGLIFGGLSYFILKLAAKTRTQLNAPTKP